MRNGGYGEQHYRAVLTEDIVRQSRQLRKEGMSYAALSDRFGVTKDAIRKALIGNTWKQLDRGYGSTVSKYKPKGVAKSRLSREGREKITELYGEGHSAVAIAQQLGIHRGTVYKYIREMK